MPDHVHIIVYPNQAQASVPARTSDKGSAGRDARARGGVNNLMHSIKSYFAHRVFEVRPNTPFAWQPRYHSRVLNTPERLRNAIEYVQSNALRHNLQVRYTKAPYVYIAKNIPL